MTAPLLFVFTAIPGGIEMLGHGGTTGGYQCFVYNLPAQGITIAGMMNKIPGYQMLLMAALEILVPEFSPWQPGEEGRP